MHRLYFQSSLQKFKAADVYVKTEIIGALILAIFIVSIYISTSISIILSALVGVIWIATLQFKRLPLVVKQSPVNVWALLVFSLFVIGLYYGNTPSEEANAILRKYRELTFIPLFSCFFCNERYRKSAWIAIVVGSLLTLLASYLMEMKLMELNRYRTFTLKSRITHGIFIAFFVYCCLHKCFGSPNNRLWYWAVIIIGIHNLFFVTNGRTGQLIFVLLIALFAFQRLNKKGILLALTAMALLLALYVQFSEKSSRVNIALETIKTYVDPTYQRKSKDNDSRIAYWQNSVKLIAEKPWLGHGTGSFGREYLRISHDKLSNLQNPHNEYLLIVVQFGLLGFLIYLGFLYSQYHYANKLATEDKWLAQGLLLTLMVASMFNSPFLDHSEGHWFAVMVALCFSPLLNNNIQTLAPKYHSQTF